MEAGLPATGNGDEGIFLAGSRGGGVELLFVTVGLPDFGALRFLSDVPDQLPLAPPPPNPSAPPGVNMSDRRPTDDAGEAAIGARLDCPEVVV
jgi:hypothetical protein